MNRCGDGEEMTTHKLTKDLVNIPNCPDWIHFFVIFSRFEYALKRSGFLIGGEKGKDVDARPDWNEFAKKIQSQLTERKRGEEDLPGAIDYLNKYPPKKQIVKLGASRKELGWKSSKPTGSETEVLSIYIRRVRNNLFHGEKGPSGLVAETSRNNKLIRHSITVLKYFLHSSDKVRECYCKPLYQE